MLDIMRSHTLADSYVNSLYAGTLPLVKVKDTSNKGLYLLLFREILPILSLFGCLDLNLEL